MTKYKYTAINLQKQKFTGTFIAENKDDLMLQLQKQGLFLVSCKAYSSNVKQKFFSFSLSSKISIKDINTFSRQFSIMLNSGMPVLSCLDLLKQQHFSDVFLQVINMIDDDVRGGLMLSDAIEKHKKVFPDFFRRMVKVGEKSGQLEMVLNSLADYYENEDRTKNKIKSALAYPLFLMAMTVGIVLLMLFYIVPTFRESLSSLDVEATGLTKAIYDISDFLFAYWDLLLLGIVAFVGLIYLILKSKGGRLAFDKFKVTAPLISNMNISRITAQFASSFNLLLASGMDVIEALESAIIVFDNKYLEEKYLKAIVDVKKGETISSSFEKYKIFPQVLTQMISVGEKTNSLDQILAKTGSFFDDEVNRAIDNFTAILQPLLLVIMGGVIGTMFIAVYSPILNIMESF